MDAASQLAHALRELLPSSRAGLEVHSWRHMVLSAALKAVCVLLLPPHFTHGSGDSLKIAFMWRCVGDLVCVTMHTLTLCVPNEHIYVQAVDIVWHANHPALEGDPGMLRIECSYRPVGRTHCHDVCHHMH